MTTKSAEKSLPVSPSPTPGRGPAIQPGIPCQLAGMSPDGAAAARMQMTSPHATRPPSARPPRRGASVRGSAIEGVAIPPSLPRSDQVLFKQPGLRAAEALVEVHLRLVAEHATRLLDRVRPATREVCDGVRAHLVLLAAQARGRVDAGRERRERRERGAWQRARALLA